MTRRARSITSVAIATLVIGCSTPGDRSASPVVTPGASLSAIPTAAAAAVPTPIVAPDPSPSPVALATSAPIDFSAAWSGITWQQLAADDPLARIRAVTPWRGGYIARGDPAAADGGEPVAGDATVHTQLWTSSDGRTWEPLAADALGTSAIVVGMAPMADGIVALTVQPGPTLVDDEDESKSWKISNALEAWTSPDGRTWTAHPGPGFDLSADLTISVHDIDWLQASTAPLLIVTRGSKEPQFVSTDGVDWKRQAASAAVPESFGLASDAGAWSGFLAVRDDAIAVSADGRTWTTTALPAKCSVGQGIVVGRDGLIVRGLLDNGGDGHSAVWTWCSSTDGRTWRHLPGSPPLGLMHGDRAQECSDSCPDGTLVGDGHRFVAYRGWADQAGWTSFDGRTWQPLTFDGRPEESAGWLDDGCTNSLVLMPMGLRCTAEDGTAWFGEPHS